MSKGRPKKCDECDGAGEMLSKKESTPTQELP